MYKKRIFSTLLALVLCVSTLSACGEMDKDKDKDKDDKAKVGVMRETTSFELAKEMKIGWNLGNTFDSVGPSETSWGNPVVTKEFVESVKAAGFNTIRIPVTWIDHTGAAPDYALDKVWLDRVQEVVDYAMDSGLYAIINIHHDGMDSGTSWLTPAPDDEEAMFNRYGKIWEQLSARFKDYSDYLIFESMNEFHKGYSSPLPEYNRITNDLNQKFVDIVRASGGNNAKRHLLIPGYNTNIKETVNGMIMPTDTIENRLIVSVHFYDPYTFSLLAETKQWGKDATESVDSWGQEDFVDQSFALLKTTYTDKNIPVIIGEFGATGGVDANFRVYYDEYVIKAAHDIGAVCIFWDNGFDGKANECFGLFNRSTGAILYPDLFDAAMRAVSGEDYTVELKK